MERTLLMAEPCPLSDQGNSGSVRTRVLAGRASGVMQVSVTTLG